MGTIKCGFWKLGFILSPKEFGDLVKYCEELEVRFSDQRNEDVVGEYQKFYNSLTSEEPPKNYTKQGNISFININGFVCNLIFGENVGFGMNPATMGHWPHYKEVVRIYFWAVQITLQKSVSVDINNGKHFIYEDIQLHSPNSYPQYQNISSYIKGMTKPLRFKAYTIDGVEEVKPSVRITEQVANDLANSWIFKNFEFKMMSYTPNK